MEGRTVRVGLIGSSCTGKTCMVKRFTENSFHGSNYNPTPGIDFYSRRLTVKPIGVVNFIILDIGGIAMTSKMLRIYLHSIDIFILNYDMTNSSTLNDLRKWIEILYMMRGDQANASIALVGSKGDLEHLRTVMLDVHTKFAQEFNIPLSFLGSAKSGESVLTCFIKCAMYHLNPEAKQKIRDHAIIQNTFNKRASLPGSGSTAGSLSQLPLKQTSLAAANDPNSVVCALQ